MSEVKNAERQTKPVQIYAYDRENGKTSRYPVDELNDKLVWLKEMCENHTDCYIELQGGYDGEWGLVLYGNELESQEEANARELAWSTHNDKMLDTAEKREKRKVKQAIKLLKKQGYNVKKEKT